MSPPRFEPIALDLARRVSAVSLVPLQGLSDKLRAPELLKSDEHLQNFHECYGALLGAARQLLGAPQFSSLARFHDLIEEEYQPSGPPRSPVCSGDFAQLILGQVPQGLAGETPLSVVARLVEVAPSRAFLAPLAHSMALAHWQPLRVEQVAEQSVSLSSLQGQFSSAVFPAKSWLKPGDGILARVVQFGTRSYLADPPYLLGASAAEWQQYVERVRVESLRKSEGPVRRSNAGKKKKSKRKGREVRLARDPVAEHFRFGESPRFWFDFIVGAFAGERNGLVRLQGIPDQPKTWAHSETTELD